MYNNHLNIHSKGIIMSYKINGTRLTIRGFKTKLNNKQIIAFGALAKESPALVSSDNLRELCGDITRHAVSQVISTMRLELRDIECVKILTHNTKGYSIEFTESDKQKPESGEWWKVECASGYNTCLFFLDGMWADAECDGNVFDFDSINPLYRMVKG
jgi:hypothetical protein